MKKVFFSIAFLAWVSLTKGQTPSNPLPDSIAIIAYNLEVGYNVNTTIAFPGKIKKAYWGDKDIIAQAVPGVDNVLLVKGANKDFAPTNLQVFTSDGSLYSFNVIYKNIPILTMFDLRKLGAPRQNVTASDLIFSDQPINDNVLDSLIRKVIDTTSFLSKRTKEYDMKLRLNSIFYSHNLFLFKLGLSNQSNLDYETDFIRLYTRDKKKSKHSSFQEQEIIPVRKIIPLTIHGLRQDKIVMVIPKFTIPEEKEFYLEVYEKNGGRNISMRIKNKTLFKAKAL